MHGSAHKIRVDNNALKVGNNVLTVNDGELLARVDYNPEAMIYTDNQTMPVLYDSSGNHIHGYQDTTAKRGIYKTNQINGLPVFETDGVDDNWFLPYAILAKTVFVVFRNLTGGGTVHSLFGNPLISWEWASNASTNLFSYNGSINPTTNLTGPNNIAHNRAFINGSDTPIDPATISRTTGIWTLLCLDIQKGGTRLGVVGSDYRAGVNNNEGELFGKFQYARVIVFDQNLPAIQRQKIRNELLTKYGL